MIAFVFLGVLGAGLLLVSLVFDDLLGDLFDLPFLSGTAIGGFLAAFGWAGVLATPAVGAGVATLIGLGAGVAIGGVAAAASAWFKNDDHSLTPSMSNVVGRVGVVVAAVPVDGFGTVAVTIGSHSNRYSARCETPLAIGAPVEIVASLSSTAVQVKPTDPALVTPLV